MKKPSVTKFKPTDGRYWFASMDQDWGVFWSHPEFGEWHRLVAKFPSRERAEAYAVAEGFGLKDELAQADQVQGPPEGAEQTFCELQVQNPDSLPMYVEAFKRMGAKPDAEGRLILPESPIPPPAAKGGDLADVILESLPELFSQNPTGVTARHLASVFGARYDAILYAMRWLHDTGKAQFLYRGNQRAGKALFPLGARRASPTMTPVQERVLLAMQKLSDDSGLAFMGYREIAIEAKVSKDSVSSALTGLRQKGYIHLVNSGNHSTPSTYKVSPEPTEADGTPFAVGAAQDRANDYPVTTQDGDKLERISFRRLRIDQAAAKLEAELPLLIKKLPGGVTVPDIVRRHGLSYGEAQDAARVVGASGAAEWVAGGRGRKVLIPKGYELQVSELAPRQQAILDVMRKHADEYSHVRLSQRKLAEEAGIIEPDSPKGSASNIGDSLWKLEMKGYIIKVQPASASGSEPAVYKLL